MKVFDWRERGYSSQRQAEMIETRKDNERFMVEQFIPTMLRSVRSGMEHMERTFFEAWRWRRAAEIQAVTSLSRRGAML